MRKLLKKQRVQPEIVSKPVAFHDVPFGQATADLRFVPRGQYWVRQTGDTTQNKKLGPTEIENQFDVGGFKFDDAPSRWELAPADLEVVSCSRLLHQFYRESCWWRKPMVWARDPEKKGLQLFPDREVIMALYGKNFHITIERYTGEMFGPHPARLYYRSTQVQGELGWIGIVQLEAMWHSDERMLKALNHEIRNRRFYQSGDTGRTIVLK